MRKLRFICAAALTLGAFSLITAAPPVNGQGQGKGQNQGKGIGPVVSGVAKGGVHGQQLAAQVQAAQAAQGIGQVNGKGPQRKGQGMKGGPQGKGKP